MVSFVLGKEIEKDVFRHFTSMGERKNSESPWGIEPQTFGFRARMPYHWATETKGSKVSAESEGLRFDSSWGLRSYSFSLVREKKKNIFLYFFTELKTYQISYSIYKHYAIDVANPSKCIQCIFRTRTVRERDWLSRERSENQHRVSWLGRRSNCLHQFKCRIPYFIPKRESHRVLRKGT